MDGVDAVLYMSGLYLAQKKTDTSINHCDSSHRDRLGFYAEIIFLTVKLNS